MPAAASSSASATTSGEGAAKDDAKAMSFYKQSCAHDHDKGCYNAGILTETGRATPKYPVAAQAWYDKACRLGHEKACNKVATHAATAPLPVPTTSSTDSYDGY
jgi:TPR repeat protein